jgi:hypothetical protein
MDGMSMKDEWRCVIVESGRLLVMGSGVRKKQGLSVDSSTTQTLQVHITIIIRCLLTLQVIILNSLEATYVRRGCAGQGHEDQDTLEVVWGCSGEESKLLDCNRTNTAAPCYHKRDAGVYCSGIY